MGCRLPGAGRGRPAVQARIAYKPIHIVIAFPPAGPTDFVCPADRDRSRTSRPDQHHREPPAPMARSRRLCDECRPTATTLFLTTLGRFSVGVTPQHADRYPLRHPQQDFGRSAGRAQPDTDGGELNRPSIRSGPAEAQKPSPATDLRPRPVRLQKHPLDGAYQAPPG